MTFTLFGTELNKGTGTLHESFPSDRNAGMTAALAERLGPDTPEDLPAFTATAELTGTIGTLPTSHNKLYPHHESNIAELQMIFWMN